MYICFEKAHSEIIQQRKSRRERELFIDVYKSVSPFSSLHLITPNSPAQLHVVDQMNP